ncbi:MAG: hypothetical protein AB1646_15000 [Thermodesulfobacteriota bacterium]
MRTEYVIKGHCDKCPKNLDCPRMRGENLCFGGKERIAIDSPEDGTAEPSGPTWTSSEPAQVGPAPGAGTRDIRG